MEDVRAPLPVGSNKLLVKFRAYLRLSGKSLKTENNYVYWIRRLILFNNKLHPDAMTKDHLQEFLEDLVLVCDCSRSTQRVVLAAFKCFFEDFSGRPLGELIYPKSQKPSLTKLPFTDNEVIELFNALDPDFHLIMNLMLVSGMRVQEAVQLRVGDLHIDRKSVFVREGKGSKSRLLPLPEAFIKTAQKQVDSIKKLHDFDLSCGFGYVYLPKRLSGSRVSVNNDFRWQFLFPERFIAIEPNSKQPCRHHITVRKVQKTLMRAVKKTSIMHSVGCHTFRHYPDNLIMPSELLQNCITP